MASIGELDPDAFPYHPVKSVSDLADRGDEDQVGEGEGEDGVVDFAGAPNSPSAARDRGNVVSLLGRAALRRIRKLLHGEQIPNGGPTRPLNK